MGTRADFYVGKGKTAEWIGSIAWDGYPDGISKKILKSKSARYFRNAVAACLTLRSDTTFPKDGWPWPWYDSSTTDYAYAYHKGRVYVSCFGSPWFNPNVPRPDDEEKIPGKKAVFPSMKRYKQRESKFIGQHTGLIVVSSRES